MHENKMLLNDYNIVTDIELSRPCLSDLYNLIHGICVRSNMQFKEELFLT
jgi:hypothetical protein